MAITIQEVIELFDSPKLAHVEEAIVAAIGSSITRDHLDIIAKFSLEEISLAGLSCQELRNYLQERKDDIIKFSIALLEDESATSRKEEYPPVEEVDESDFDPEIVEHGYSVGCSITYVTYIHLIENGTKADLSNYLKARGIPYRGQFARDLRRLHAATIGDS